MLEVPTSTEVRLDTADETTELTVGTGVALEDVVVPTFVVAAGVEGTVVFGAKLGID